MLFHAGQKWDAEGYQVYRENDITVYYKGFFFLRGYHAGEESVQKMLEFYAADSCFDFQKYYGSFRMAVQFPEGDYIFFTDNSRMNCYFYSANLISDNFLKLVKELPEESCKFDRNAVNMLFYLGGIYFERTLIKDVRVLNSFEYLFVKNGQMKKLKKQISDIDGTNTILERGGVESFFKDVARALESYKTVCAITGGYDSRMVLAILNNYIDLDLFISGDNEDNIDIMTAKKVAGEAGLPLEIVKMDNEINEEWVKYSFSYFQGMCPSSHYMFHNIMEFNLDRAKKGYQIALNGDGGVLHKDWEWMQDFPFYHRKHTDFQRLYRQRVRMLDYSQWLGDAIEPEETFDAKMIGNIKKFGKRTNSQTYDSYYFNVYLAKNTPYANANEISYGPLMEYDMVKYSYHLPRRERYFCNFIRKTTTKANEKIAGIRTVYGTNASCRKKDLTIDFFIQFVQYLKKAKRYLTRKYKNYNNVTEDLSKENVNEKVRQLEIARQAVAFCTEQGYLKEGLDYEKIPFPLIDRAIQVYLLDSLGRGET